MGIKRRIIKNVVSVQIEKTFTRVITFLFGVFVARRLPLEAFGQWTVVFIFFRLFELFTEIGTSRVATRDIPRNPESAGKYLIHLYFIKGTISLILSIVLIFTIWLLKYPSQTTQLLYFAVPLLIISTFKQPLMITIQGLERMEFTAGFGLGTTLLYVSSGITCLLLGHGVVALLWMAILSEGISFVLMVVVFQKYFFRTRFEFDLSFCKYLLKEGWYFGLAEFLTLLLHKLDFIFLSKLKGDAVVAIYGAGYRIVEPALFSIRGIIKAIRPSVSRLLVSSPEKVKIIYSRLMNMALIIVPPLLFLITIFSKELVLLIYGEKFLPTKDVVVILTWAAAVMPFNIPMRIVISVSSEFPQYVFFLVGITILNIILNIILIPPFSYIGAATATLICISLNFPICIFFFRRVLGPTQSPKLIAKGILGITGMISLYLLTRNLNILINVTLPILGYLLILRLSGLLKIENIKEIFL